MCIAIFQPEGTPDLSVETLHTCYVNNPDGMGLMYAKDGRIETYHTLRRFSRFVKQYKRARQEGGHVVLHFRIGTSGSDGIENCHPFKVNKGLHFVHNGMIEQCEPPRDDATGRCDTRVFRDRILKGMREGWLEDHVMTELIGEYIGYSKLVFLRANGTVNIINPELGEWGTDGVWYSNDSYKPEVPSWRGRTNTFEDHDDWQPINKEQGHNDKGETVEDMYERLWQEKLDDDAAYEGASPQPVAGVIYRAEFYCGECLPVDAQIGEMDALPCDEATCSVCHQPIIWEM